MPSFENFQAEQRVKLLLIGDSGAGKTGSLANLANAGYQLRIVDLEGNLNVLNSFLTEEGKKNINYVTFDPEDARCVDGIERITRTWKTATEDFGEVKKWDNNHVLVIDSATRLGDACLAATAATTKDGRSHYMAAGDKFHDILAWTNGLNKLKCNVIYTAHVRYVEVPHDKILDQKTLKAYPSCLGSKMPQEFSRAFTDVFSIKVSASGQKVTRVFRTDADSLMGMKSSAPNKLAIEEAFDLGVVFNKLLDRNSVTSKQ